MGIFKLTITVPDPDTVYDVFDRIEVHRSENGEPGPYFAITADVAAAATLLSANPAPFTLNGTTLKLIVDEGVEQTITFSTTDPTSIDDAVIVVNAQAAGFVASEESGQMRLTSLTDGTSSVVEITGGTALGELGFSVADRDTGEDTHIPLSPLQEEYEYLDRTGETTYAYKTRYYASATGQYSSFSEPALAEVSAVLPAASLILTTIDLAGLDGAPVAERMVVVYNKYVPQVEDGYVLAGKEVRMLTDAVGHAETYLVRGSQVSVAIAGTNIVRDVEVPTVGTSFDLGAALATADDVFQIHTPDIPAAVRRS